MEPITEKVKDSSSGEAIQMWWTPKASGWCKLQYVLQHWSYAGEQTSQPKRWNCLRFAAPAEAAWKLRGLEVQRLRGQWTLQREEATQPVREIV